MEILNSSWQSILDALPPLCSRKQLSKASGGLVAIQTLANHDSKGTGIVGRIQVGKRVVYPKDNAIRWLMHFSN